MRRLFFFSTVLLAAAFQNSGAEDALRLPSLFSEGMVLQQARPVPVWGWAAPGETVRVSFAGQEKSAVAGDDGRWQVALDPLKPEDKGDMTVRAASEITIRNVLVGEVWLCSGQSNMDAYTYHLEPVDRGTKHYDGVRFFVVQRAVGAEPRQDVTARWTQCRPDEQCLCSAIGYLFARDLHERLGVPVGIVQSTWGDTRVEFWTPLATLQADPGFASYVADWEKEAPQITTWAGYEKQWHEWKANPSGAEPFPPQKIPSSIFNGMIAPLAPFAMRGVLWYQGESNAYQAGEYRKLFPAMIASWRTAWNNPELPFFFVQLPNYEKRDTEPPNVSPWSELREAQALALSLPATEMAVTIDIGEEDIHPRNKPEVARRLINIALAKVYSQPVPYTGPRFREATFSGDHVLVSFDHVEGGLLTSDDKPPRGFALAGPDKKWHWAEARIQDNAVLVQSANVPKPQAVRYAWAHNPDCNLINGARLPAAPFRTDR